MTYPADLTECSKCPKSLENPSIDTNVRKLHHKHHQTPCYLFKSVVLFFKVFITLKLGCSKRCYSCRGNMVNFHLIKVSANLFSTLFFPFIPHFSSMDYKFV